MKKSDHIFEVKAGDGRIFRIWADGRVDGFGSDAIVVNRIPTALREAWAQGRRDGEEAGIQAGQMGSATPPEFTRN